MRRMETPNNNNSLNTLRMAEIILDLKINSNINCLIDDEEIKRQLSTLHPLGTTHNSADTCIACPTGILLSDCTMGKCFASGFEGDDERRGCIIVINNEDFNYSVKDLSDAVLFYLEHRIHKNNNDMENEKK